MFAMTRLLEKLLFGIDLISERVKAARLVCELCDVDISQFCRLPFDNLLIVRGLLFAGVVFAYHFDREGIKAIYLTNLVASQWIREKLMAVKYCLGMKEQEQTDLTFKVLFKTLENLSMRNKNPIFTVDSDCKDMLDCSKMLHCLNSFLYLRWEGFESEEVM